MVVVLVVLVVVLSKWVGLEYVTWSTVSTSALATYSKCRMVGRLAIAADLAVDSVRRLPDAKPVPGGPSSYCTVLYGSCAAPPVLRAYFDMPFQ